MEWLGSLGDVEYRLQATQLARVYGNHCPTEGQPLCAIVMFYPLPFPCLHGFLLQTEENVISEEIWSRSKCFHVAIYSDIYVSQRGSCCYICIMKWCVIKS